MAFFGKKKNKTDEDEDVENSAVSNLEAGENNLLDDDDLNDEVNVAEEEELEDPEYLEDDTKLLEDDTKLTESEDDELATLQAKIAAKKKEIEVKKKAKVEAVKKLQQPEAVGQQQIIYKARAVPIEDMFNNISDRMELLENWAREMSEYMKSKLE